VGWLQRPCKTHWNRIRFCFFPQANQIIHFHHFFQIFLFKFLFVSLVLFALSKSHLLLDGHSSIWIVPRDWISSPSCAHSGKNQTCQIPSCFAYALNFWGFPSISKSATSLIAENRLHSWWIKLVWFHCKLWFPMSLKSLVQQKNTKLCFWVSFILLTSCQMYFWAYLFLKEFLLSFLSLNQGHLIREFKEIDQNVLVEMSPAEFWIQVAIQDNAFLDNVLELH